MFRFVNVSPPNLLKLMPYGLQTTGDKATGCESFLSMEAGDVKFEMTRSAARCATN